MSKGSIIRREGKNGAISWLVKYDAGRDPATGRRRQRYATVKGTKRDAERELRKLLAQIDQGTHVDPSRVTLADWIETWLADHAAPSVSAKTLERYGELLRLHVVPRIGALPAQKLTAPAIQRVYSELLTSGRRSGARTAAKSAPAGLSARTVLHVHRVLFQCLSIAVKQRVMTRNPVLDVTPPNPKRAQMEGEGKADATQPIRALERDQLEALLKSMRQHPLFPLAAVAAGTGMRRGEILGLRWLDIDLDQKTIRVERTAEDTKARGVLIKHCPKNDSSRRTIGIDEGLALLLRSVRKAQLEDALKLGRRLPEDALAFPSSPLDPSKPRRPRAVTKEFARLARKLIPGFRLHDLRHTHATLLLLAGVPINAVAQRLGHSSPVTTMTVYAHVLRRAEDRAAEVSGDLLRGALAEI